MLWWKWDKGIRKKNLSYEGCYLLWVDKGALCSNVQYATGKISCNRTCGFSFYIKNDNTMWVYYMLKLMDLYRYHTGAAAQPGLAVKKLNTIDVIICRHKPSKPIRSLRPPNQQIEV